MVRTQNREINKRKKEREWKKSIYKNGFLPFSSSEVLISMLRNSPSSPKMIPQQVSFLFQSFPQTLHFLMILRTLLES